MEVKSIRCADMLDTFIKIEINLTADIVIMDLGAKSYEANMVYCYDSCMTMLICFYLIIA